MDIREIQDKASSGQWALSQHAREQAGKEGLRIKNLSVLSSGENCLKNILTIHEGQVISSWAIRLTGIPFTRSVLLIRQGLS